MGERDDDDEPMPAREGHVASLLRDYGVEPDALARRDAWRRGRELLSIRDAAKRCGVSRETLARLMRPTPSPRRIRKANLDMIATGLGIPRESLEAANLADWGYVQTLSPDTVADLMQRIGDLARADQEKLHVELANRLYRSDR